MSNVPACCVRTEKGGSNGLSVLFSEVFSVPMSCPYQTVKMVRKRTAKRSDLPFQKPRTHHLSRGVHHFCNQWHVGFRCFRQLRKQLHSLNFKKCRWSPRLFSFSLRCTCSLASGGWFTNYLPASVKKKTTILTRRSVHRTFFRFTR